MLYRGTIIIDFTGPDANAYTRLALALRESGWRHVETSSFVRDTNHIHDLWDGIGIVARFAWKVGTLSALTFTIQGTKTDFATNVSLKSTQSPATALDEIRSMPFPTP